MSSFYIRVTHIQPSLYRPVPYTPATTKSENTTKKIVHLRDITLATMHKKLNFLLLLALAAVNAAAAPLTPELQQARRQFADAGLGIFIHWGIYSMFGQGEWYLHSGGVDAAEYAKAAGGFYPAAFDAKEWADAIRDSGARYVTFTSRHHDGFSMWDTGASDYDIMDATPFRRDIVGELARACRDDSLRLHLYYSLIDWTRPDYPWGRTGHLTGRDSLATAAGDWPSYKAFMHRQLTELLTQYGPIGAIWLDGVWDHDQDTVPFDWQLQPMYDLVHTLQPGCLVANNHHLPPMPGEDIQVFERDVPGDNTAGYSGESGISRSLPLETCQTINGSWGYRVKDLAWKSLADIIRLLVRTRGMGANLLLNVGPQPDGRIPAASLERLRGLGRWMRRYGATIYGAGGSPFGQQPWGTATQKGDTLYLHILDRPSDGLLRVPYTGRVRHAAYFDQPTRRVPLRRTKDGLVLRLEDISAHEANNPDLVIALTLRK